MKSSLNLFKKSANGTSKGLATFLLVFVIFFSLLTVPVHEAKAQNTDPVQATIQAAKWVWEKVAKGATYLWNKGGSLAFQQTIRTAVSKVAYDTATWLGSGDKGQKPLFITQDWGAYLAQVGDEAAGQFIESFTSNLAGSISSDAIYTECQKAYTDCARKCIEDGGACKLQGKKDCNKIESDCKDACKTAATNCNKNGGTGGATSSTAILSVKNNSGNAVPSINICQPSSIEASLKISLGLVEQTRPGAPNCTASTMVQNWGDEVQRLKDYEDPYFANKIVGIFNPVSNDLGIALSVRSDMVSQQVTANENNKLGLAANKGWKDKVNIAKNLIGVPGEAEKKRDSAGNLQNATFGQVTGDILVDAASIFLNQIALTGFNTLMANLGKKATDPNNDPGGNNLTNASADPSVAYGDVSIQQASAFIIKPNFGVQADYDILNSLAACADKNNPGPTSCVIDSQFMQGITEKKTVAEAVTNAYINGTWSLTKDTEESAYSLRSISILRKYRILPIGWEEAVNRAYASSTNVKKFTVNDLISCFDQSDSYNQYSQNFNVRDQAWCRGLVDPNWVLKAPLNYCSKLGVGAQLISQSSLDGTYSVSRAEDYCADEKTCIKEKSDGSCEAYGYCNEEKRTWNFSSDSCEAIDNTCNTFKNASNGRQASYLENTLNYSDCNADTAGCRQYSTSGDFATTTGMVSWNANKSIYFNKNVTTCNGKDEGCNELIRIKPTWGANLVMNANFGNDQINASSTGATNLNDWPLSYSEGAYLDSSKATIVDTSVDPGEEMGTALKLEASGTSSGSPLVAGVYSSPEHSLLPDNFQLMSGESYTFSADVYVVNGQASAYLGDDKALSQTITAGSWQHLSVTKTATDAFNKPLFGVLISSLAGANNVKAYVKNLKFEISNFETEYSIYGIYRFYQKIIPPYLEKACYNDANAGDFSLRSNAPAVCNNFARKCASTEVGCELFTNQKSKLNVSAKVASSDYCAKECVGYDMYISKENFFTPAQSENLIPTTANTCNAEAVGCTEFTNLDELAQGGETKEYYTSLKHCIKPSQSLCSSFYSWEGTASGYQLRLYSLQKGTTPATSGEPKEVGAVNYAACNSIIYNKPVGDPSYNPDCREFYNAAGKVSYHLMSKTITCSENCHAYRMSGENPSSTCLNGGAWDATLKACIYQAVPGEGKTCNAADNGCREYNGNDGNNTQNLSSYDFETGAQGWNSNCVGGIQLSNISNNKDGHSIYYKNNAPVGDCAKVGKEAQGSVVKSRLINQVFASDNIAAQLKVGNSVSQNKSYTVRFIAKTDTGDTNLQIYLYNNDAANPEKAYFATSTLVVKGGGEWGIYQANLDNLDHLVTTDESLIITADKAFYFDEVVLTEITDRYYLINNTSVIPPVCYYDMSDNYQGAEYNLGCSAYSDRSNNTHNLRKFSKLCSKSSVGCEQMVDTKNYTPYGSNIWGDTNKNGTCDNGETDCVSVAKDSIIYAVYDDTKKCNPADKSCSRLGQAVSGATDWSDVFKKNNPDLYDKNLCGQTELNCEEWTLSDGSKSYFKDPGSEVCQYRASHDPSASGKSWYKVPVKRCDADGKGSIDGAEMSGKTCSSNNECGGKTCMVDNNDYVCSTSNLKTFGTGGANNSILQPDKQAGLCDANAAGCTEYIDPVSKFSPNLINNPNYEKLPDDTVESWTTSSTGNWQDVNIEKNKLYVFSATSTSASASATSLTFKNNVRILLSNNTLSDVMKSVSIQSASNSVIIASFENSTSTVTGGESGKTIELKESIVNYQIKENVDTNSCNGSVNFDNGCVLFNERSVNGSNGVSSLESKWDAAASILKKTPYNCDKTVVGSCTANQLVKVRPNRTCSKWLDCVSYLKDPKTGEKVCYAVGECNRLGDNKECASYEDAATSTIKFSNNGLNQNATGYYLLDKYHLSNMKEVGLNSDAHYDFEDSVPTLSCKRVDGQDCSFHDNIVVDLLQRGPNNPPVAYPAHGLSYLKVPASFLVSPQSASTWVSVIPFKKYFINFLVNTEKSGSGAIVKLTTKNTTGKTYSREYNFYSNNGWSRQIFSFDPGAADKIRIDLGATATTSDWNVYFDDINIEPVLEVGENAVGAKQYVSRECRLYPTNDSLTCVNKNNNVLKDGLEGYCLVHDSSNPDVCLMWYPVDKIASTQLARTSTGYQGKFPLNYCTEVNGNFDLVVKLKPYDMGISCYDNELGCGEISWSNGRGFNLNPSLSDNKNGVHRVYGLKGVKCKAGYRIAFYMHKPNVFETHFYCIPDGTLLARSNESVVFDKCDDVAGLTDDDGTTHACSIDVSYLDGWYKLNATSPQNYENITNPIRVYDYDNKPVDEDGLKLVSGNDPESVYRFTCNKFIQVVDNNGENQAWAKRTGMNALYPTSTPPFFTAAVNLDRAMAAYGSNRQDTPFGAALWPDSFNLLSSGAPVKLRNQFSTRNSEDTLAGRPYGCANGPTVGGGTGCSNIGYCSLDANVYCLTSARLKPCTPTTLLDCGIVVSNSIDGLDKKTCAEAGLGTCVPLWGQYLGTAHSADAEEDYQPLLRTIFLNSYNSYSYVKPDEAYAPGNLDIKTIPGLCKNTPYNSGNVRIGYTSCSVYPTIQNIKFNDAPLGATASVTKKDIYMLSFTTNVDVEQQPLKQIHINWGDNTEQLITGQDSHQDPKNPHIFYHYYSSISEPKIEIDITDNWDISSKLGL